MQRAAPLATESVNLPRSLLRPDHVWAAIDCGSTLLKFVFVDKEEAASGANDVTFHAHMYHKTDMETVLQIIRERVHIPSSNAPLAMSGVGFAKLKDSIEKALDVKLVFVIENRATTFASQMLLKFKTDDEIFFAVPPNTKDRKFDTPAYIKPVAERAKARMTANDHQGNGPPMTFMNIGSGIIFTYHEDADTVPPLIDFCPLGGLPFLGLAKLLLGTNDYDEITNLAAKGDVNKCYWLFKDNVPGNGEQYGKTDPDYPSFAFGRVFYHPDLEYSKEDMAAALVFFFAQIAHSSACHFAEISGVSRFYVTGNWPRSEIVRRFLSEQRTAVCPNVVEYKFFNFGMMTVLGALLKANSEQEE